MLDYQHDVDLCRRLREVYKASFRRAPLRRAPRKKRPLSSTLRKEIDQEYQRDPLAHQQDIANKLGANAGRVSEALRGYRDGRKVLN